MTMAGTLGLAARTTTSEDIHKSMGSWTCSLCETGKRWPSKEQAMDHIEANHIDVLVRASLQRRSEDPNQELEV